MKYANARFSACQLIGNHIIGSCAHINSLFDMNIDSGDVTVLGFFEGVDECQEIIHRDSCVLDDGNIAFFPENERHISLYNIKSGISHTIDMGLQENAGYNAYNVGDEIILIPLSAANPIIHWNYHNDKCVRSISPNSVSKLNGKRLLRGAMYQNKILNIVYGTDIICCYDYEKKNIELISTGIGELHNIFTNEDNIWLMPIEEHVFCAYNLEEKTYHDFRYDELAIMDSKGEMFNSIIEVDNKIYLFPTCPGSILVYDLIESRYEDISLPSDMERDKYVFWMHKKTQDGKYIVFSSGIDYVIMIDNDNVNFIKINGIKDCYNREIYLSRLLRKGVIREGMNISLECFLDNI